MRSCRVRSSTWRNVRSFSAWIKHYKSNEFVIPPKTSDPSILYAPLPDNRGKVAYCLHHAASTTPSSSSSSSSRDPSSSIHSPINPSSSSSSSLSSIPLVIAVHGAPGSTFDWRYLGTVLEPHVKLLRFAVPGHAETPESTTVTPSAKHISETLWRSIDTIRTMQQHKPSPSLIAASSSSSSSSASVDHPIYLLSHSLGHEVITAMVHERPHLIKGIICISPVGVRPHAAIRPWNIVRMIGHLSYRQGLFRYFIDRYLYFLYVYGFGFPKRLSYQESGWCAQRVAFRNYSQMQENIQEIVKLRIPVLLSHAKDDKIVEESIFNEVLKTYEGNSEFLNDSVQEDNEGLEKSTKDTPASEAPDYHEDYFRRKRVRVAFFDNGGHMLIKTQATLLGTEIVNWITDVEKGICGSRNNKKENTTAAATVAASHQRTE